ncbi:MAG: hypothetical protein HYX77_06065, partial [Acidobacteria bacterium]|nr:hypothetical protein [Acidobacteriota bacterium]
MGDRLGVRTQFVGEMPWQKRERGFDRGEIEVCWMCGWPYAVRADSPSAGIDLIAAPVMAGPRYLDRPVYFSDIVVRADGRFDSFKDLRGGSWALVRQRQPRSCPRGHLSRIIHEWKLDTTPFAPKTGSAGRKNAASAYRSPNAAWGEGFAVSPPS